MDPYLELRWRDFHGAMIFCARERLNQSLPPDLVARSEDRVYVDVNGERLRTIYPDVRVSEQQTDAPMGGLETSALAVAQPVILDIETEPIKEHFLEILEVDGERVVTAIEFISPANKESGPGREAYLSKREEFFESAANLVEVDLVRTGDWLSLIRPYRVPPIYRTMYRVCVRRVMRHGKAELYPITLRQRLPVIAIPLRNKDPDLQLDLQELLDRAYESGRYAGTDYRRECDPLLSDDDAAWAGQLLRQAGRR